MVKDKLISSFKLSKTRDVHETKLRGLYRDIKSRGNYTDIETFKIMTVLLEEIYEKNTNTGKDYKFIINNGTENKLTTEYEYQTQYKNAGWVLGSIKKGK